ncbi:hypothetical protein [Streptomyces sp. YGL11-2]|uniref:hypothetical protein n=1 Tax=Streptomyces sp. YGL11-2 TaxID=3414028 RepID=UPI003CE82130
MGATSHRDRRRARRAGPRGDGGRNLRRLPHESLGPRPPRRPRRRQDIGQAVRIPTFRSHDDAELHYRVLGPAGSSLPPLLRPAVGPGRDAAYPGDLGGMAAHGS